jgi:hypothetical protein
MTWERMTQLVNDWLPKPIILHPWPSDRFAVTHPRWEPYAGKPPVRFCAEGRSVMSVPTASDAFAALHQSAHGSAPEARITSGGRIHPETCRLIR